MTYNKTYVRRHHRRAVNGLGVRASKQLGGEIEEESQNGSDFSLAVAIIRHRVSVFLASRHDAPEVNAMSTNSASNLKSERWITRHFIRAKYHNLRVADACIKTCKQNLKIENVLDHFFEYVLNLDLFFFCRSYVRYFRSSAIF